MKNLKLFNIILTVALSMFAASSMAKSEQLLDQVHFSKGIKCASCHGNVQPREEVKMVTCIKCHNTQKLAASTKNMKPTNVHNNRHFGTEENCTNCHHVHQKSENACVSCHPRWDFKVP